MIAHALQGDGERAAELFEMLNPINHGCTRAGIHRYKAEPYVIAADVYSEPPHTGGAAGVGTAALPGGCIAPASNSSLDSSCAAARS